MPGPRARGNFLACATRTRALLSKSFIRHQQRTSFAFAIHERIGNVGNKHADRDGPTIKICNNNTAHTYCNYTGPGLTDKLFLFLGWQRCM
eukprot:scaffold44633_cov460-Skeletonema_marinoi.AAC.2